jgi:hypothetical protein
MQGSVSVKMRAPAERIWSLIADVTEIGRFSPETFEAQWSDGATGPVLGARFRGHVKRNGKGPVYWTNCVVTACESGRVFAFNVVHGDAVVNSWRYDLRDDGEFTEVTESFELPRRPLLRVYWTLLGWARSKTNESGMRATLERIREVVEADGV